MFLKQLLNNYSVAVVVSGLMWTPIQSLAQSFERYEQKLDGTDLSFSMEAIPGGVFSMGNDQSPKEDEKPAHKVRVDSFFMSTFEVSWDLYEPFIYKDYEMSHTTDSRIPENVDAVTRPTKPYLDMTFGMGKEGHPAVGMTQYNAIQFCKWLYERTGVFYRLPTEAEWEYACRAGTDTEYFFGDDASQLDEYAWYEDNSGGKTSPIGKKKPNPFGLYDILGNVSEWTYDQYIEGFYESFDLNEVIDSPVAQPTELYPHVVRGGSFVSDASGLRSSNRDYSDPSWKQLDPQIPKSNWWFPEAPFIGVRLVRPVHTPSKEEIMEYYDKAPIKDF